MTEQIINALTENFDHAIGMIERLPLVGSEGARGLQSSEWFGDDGAQFKVDYHDGAAEAVQVVGTMDMYYR